MPIRTPDPTVLDALALWVARRRDPAFRDRGELTDWLEADAHHNEAYALTLDADDAASVLEGRRPDRVDSAPVAPPRRSVRPSWISAAACVAAVVALSTLLPRYDPVVVATGVRMKAGWILSSEAGAAR